MTDISILCRYPVRLKSCTVIISPRWLWHGLHQNRQLTSKQLNGLWLGIQMNSLGCILSTELNGSLWGGPISLIKWFWIAWQYMVSDLARGITRTSNIVAQTLCIRNNNVYNSTQYFGFVLYTCISVYNLPWQLKNTEASQEITAARERQSSWLNS